MQPFGKHETASRDSHAEAAGWLAKQHGDQYTTDDQRAFIRWLNQDKANQEAYQKAQALWTQLDGLESIAARQLQEARSHLARIQVRSRHRLALFGLVVSLAAIALIFDTGMFRSADEQFYRTGVGEHSRLVLDDGSTLELDTDSEVVVRYTQENRALELMRGQAVFTVLHGDNRPFDVHAGNGVVHDIGTAFNVRRDPDQVTVTVLEGEVEVTAAGSRLPGPLLQGQQVSYNQQGDVSDSRTVNVDSAAAWRQGQLVFRAQPLKQVLGELQRYHSASLIVNSPQVNSIKVSGTFPADNLELALRTIASALNISLVQLNQTTWRFE